MGIFGARGPAGIAAQMAVGAIAGVLFARLTAPRGVSISFAHPQPFAQKD